MQPVHVNKSVRSGGTLRARPQAVKSEQEPVLEYPADSVEPARNQRPVVLLHGTLVEKDGIEAYRDFALKNGHPVSHKTYPSITRGARIEESTELASREVNRARAEVARKNVAAFQTMERTQLQEAFELDADLYGTRDADVDLIVDRIPSLTSQVARLLEQPKEQIESGLSGQLKRLESSLVAELKKDGLEGGKAAGVARELMDTIAPKAIVVGHSAGGYIAHTLSVNPEVVPDDDRFTYDGGNGVGEALILSAPIGKGLPKPAPEGVADLPFYNFDRSVLRPMERLPASQLMLANPFNRFVYNSTKSLLKQAARTNFMVTAQMSSPIIYAMRPGNEQVEEGSEFFETYVKDRPIPEGTTVIGFTSPHDKLSEEERSRLVTEQPNGHTLSVDLGVSEADLARERPTWAHVIMTEKPDSFKAQFAEHLERDGQALERILDKVNDDGARYETLAMLKESLEQEGGALSDDLRRTLARVEAEEMPFRDSPSYLASQILKKHSR